MPRTVLVDGDVLIYKAAEASCEYFEVDTEEDEKYIYRTIQRADKDTAQDYLIGSIEKIINDTKSDRAVMCISSSEGKFRKDLNPNYKSNRRKLKPVLWEFLRNCLKSNKDTWTLYEKPYLEADDVIGILATSEKIIKGDKVVWSLDKDFKTIPCKFHKAKTDGSHESKKITEEEADWNFMFQTLTGDTTDGYSGCKGIGKIKAKEILGDTGKNSCKKMWELVKRQYQKAGLTEEDALMNARMARILRKEDYDFKKKEVILWNMK